LLPPSAFLTWGFLTSPPFFPFPWKIRFSAGTLGPFSQVEHQINHANFLSSPQDGAAPLGKAGKHRRPLDKKVREAQNGEEKRESGKSRASEAANAST